MTGSARGQGGGFALGTVTLNDSSHISGNRACGRGGGVWVLGAGTLTMNGESTISANQVAFLDELEPGVGGGVANGGAVILHHSSAITGNSAERGGGGVYTFIEGTLTGVSCAPHTYANVYGNGPDDCYIEPYPR